VSGALVIAAITWITIGRLRGKTALNKPVADAGSDGQGANRSTRHAPSNER
jgi:hypothetical protein